ncbi:MAG: YihY/virulence factor BrkB family protein [Flavisolibacter sp.]|nr:YihY/virulence factor BrkB family protein [Flavisolibacter sp.]
MALHTRFKRKLITSAPARVVIQGSKKAVIPGFGGYSIFDVWQPFVHQLRNSNLIERASAISFNVFMAIPPLLIFVFTLIPYLPISSRLVNELFDLIRTIIPGKQNNTVIIDFLNDFLSRPRNELLSFGLLLAIFFSSNAMMGVLRSFDKKEEGFIKRRGVEKRSTALQLTLIVLVLVFICLLLLIAQGEVLHWIGIRNYWIRMLIVNIRWIIIFLLVLYSVSFIYRNGPALEVKWPFITPGSVFATFLMFLATFLVSIYVNNFSMFNKVYGSISAIFILMSLIFVNSLVIIAGFELNVTITSLKRKQIAIRSKAE